MHFEAEMEPVKIALNLDEGITEEEGNILAANIMCSDLVKGKGSVMKVAISLWNIGQHRISGVGFSSEVSDTISDWVEKYFDENEKYSDKLIDVIYELTSIRSDEMTRMLLNQVKNENLKGCLLEAYSYKGT